MVVADGLIDLGYAAAAVTAILGAVILIAKLPPVRWVLRHLVSDPLAGWFKVQVREEVDRAAAPILHRLGCVEEQLKPNGGKSLRDRVDRMTEQMGIAPPFDPDPEQETAA